MVRSSGCLCIYPTDLHALRLMRRKRTMSSSCICCAQFLFFCIHLPIRETRKSLRNALSISPSHPCGHHKRRQHANFQARGKLLISFGDRAHLSSAISLEHVGHLRLHWDKRYWEFRGHVHLPRSPSRASASPKDIPPSQFRVRL